MDGVSPDIVSISIATEDTVYSEDSVWMVGFNVSDNCGIRYVSFGYNITGEMEWYNKSYSRLKTYTNLTDVLTVTNETFPGREIMTVVYVRDFMNNSAYSEEITLFRKAVPRIDIIINNTYGNLTVDTSQDPVINITVWNHNSTELELYLNDSLLASSSENITYSLKCDVLPPGIYSVRVISSEDNRYRQHTATTSLRILGSLKINTTINESLTLCIGDNFPFYVTSSWNMSSVELIINNTVRKLNEVEKNNYTGHVFVNDSYVDKDLSLIHI